MDLLSGISIFRVLFPTTFAVTLVIAYWLDPTWTTQVFMGMVEAKADHVTQILQQALLPVIERPVHPAPAP